ncbi:hypothetical protein FB451DRAFT_1364939 [Mycena latifolia]|nr:hypothetical protein FB451DRAFT_1364939 [Mycena latifolia]
MPPAATIWYSTRDVTYKLRSFQTPRHVRKASPSPYVFASPTGTSGPPSPRPHPSPSSYPGETIPIQLFLGGFDPPTFRDINKKFISPQPRTHRRGEPAVLQAAGDHDCQDTGGLFSLRILARRLGSNEGTVQVGAQHNYCAHAVLIRSRWAVKVSPLSSNIAKKLAGILMLIN